MRLVARGLGFGNQLRTIVVRCIKLGEKGIQQLWSAVCAKIKIQVAFTFTVVIYGFHDGNLLKSPLGGHICGEIC